MKIASLLPSATEIVAALGLADQLVGVSHECDYPAEAVAHLPRLTRSAVPPGLSAAEIDAAVSDLLRRGASLYDVDEPLLNSLAPDVVVTQALCDVCAVSYGDVQQLAQRLTSRPRVISLTPPDIDGILDDILTVAVGVEAAERGHELVAAIRERLERVDEAVSGQPRPRVAAIEWLDPPFAGGHWVPEMIQLAGGQDVLGQAGEKSFRVTWEEVLAARPEVIALIPCGYSLEAVAVEWRTLPKPDGWEQLPAVVTGRVYALDANSYFSRPAPRVVDGVELLARVLHPERARMAGIIGPDRALLRLAAN